MLEVSFRLFKLSPLLARDGLPRFNFELTSSPTIRLPPLDESLSYSSLDLLAGGGIEGPGEPLSLCVEGLTARFLVTKVLSAVARTLCLLGGRPGFLRTDGTWLELGGGGGGGGESGSLATEDWAFCGDCRLLREMETVSGERSRGGDGGGETDVLSGRCLPRERAVSWGDVV